jgi:hypothetical protein
MTKCTPSSVFILACALVSGVTLAAQQPNTFFVEPVFDFGRVMRGTVVEHSFVLKNTGGEPLRLGNVRMSPALTLTRGAARLEPGAEGSFHFRLDTSKVQGAFDGIILVSFGAALPVAELTFTGVVVPPVEASPPAFFVAVDRGQVQEQSVEIRSAEAEPVRIESIDFSSARAAIALQTVEEGRRYRLKLTVRGDGAAGKTTQLVRVTTSSKTMPLLQIPVNTYVRERVYTFPETVDMGALPLSVIRRDPSILGRTAQTLMIYRKGATGFAAKASSDIPALSLKPERGPAGDRWQFTVTLNEDLLTAGPIRGAIVIETNDPEFPRLTVPVSGHIMER